MVLHLPWDSRKSPLSQPKNASIFWADPRPSNHHIALSQVEILEIALFLEANGKHPVNGHTTALMKKKGRGRVRNVLRVVDFCCWKHVWAMGNTLCLESASHPYPKKTQLKKPVWRESGGQIVNCECPPFVTFHHTSWWMTGSSQWLHYSPYIHNWVVYLFNK